MTTITVFEAHAGPDLAASTCIVYEYYPLMHLPKAGRLLRGSQADTALMGLLHHGAPDVSNAGSIFRVSEVWTEHSAEYQEYQIYPQHDEELQIRNVQRTAPTSAGSLPAMLGVIAGALTSMPGPGASVALAAAAYGLISVRKDTRRDVQASADLPSAVAARLKALANLPRNWNSYGAPPIDIGALAEARRIIQIASGRSGLGLPIPGVSPGAHGGVGVEWATNDGIELILDISPNDPATFVLVIPDAGGNEVVTEDYVGTNDHLEILLRHIIE